jgi:hypothetical protein
MRSAVPPASSGRGRLTADGLRARLEQRRAALRERERLAAAERASIARALAMLERGQPVTDVLGYATRTYIHLSRRRGALGVVRGRPAPREAR